MARLLYQKIAIGEMKGWIKGELLHHLPPYFFNDPVGLAKDSGGKCIGESKWRWAGFLNLPEGKRIFLKRDLTKDWMESLKYMIFPSKGRKEWFIAYQLGKRHINIPKPIGWLERIDKGFVRESYYLSEAIASKGSLAESTELLRDEKIIAELIRMLIKMHNAGLFHQDLHAGNFLWDGESLFLIDLHRAKLLRSLSLSQRLWNFAQIFHSLRVVFGKEEQLKFLNLYFEGDSISPQKVEEYLRKIYSWMDHLQKRQWKSRTRRCLRDSTEFSVIEGDGVTFYHRRDFPLDRLKGTIEKHRAIGQQTPSSLIKQSPEVKVSVFQEEGTRVCVKQFCYLHWWDRLKERLRRSKGIKAWLGGNVLKVRGLPSIKPLALVEQNNWFGKTESFLIMEAPEAGKELDRFLCKGFRGHEESRGLAKAFAHWLASLHQKGIYHQDMKACNILVSTIDQVWDFKLLDLEDIRFDKKVDERKLFKNLLQLNTSIPSHIAATDRLRFLREYLKIRPVIRDKKSFLFRLVEKSRERGTVYVSPDGIVEEKSN